MRILILGGGIGGMSAALALQKQHLDVSVFEAANSFKPLGAGIGIGSNAMEALIAMGVGAEVFAKGTVLATQLFKNTQGKVLNSIDFSQFKKLYGQENITIHRGELHETLYAALQPNTVQFAKRCSHFTNRDGIITLYFTDGTSTMGDILLAADGIHSVVRQQYLPSATPRYAGYTCWRGLTTNEGSIAEATSCEIWSPQARFGYAPMADGNIYWFACVKTTANNIFYEHLTRQQIAYIFKDFPPQIAKIIARTAPQEILHHDIYDIKPLKQFVFEDNIALLGDAAHATTPNMGQGAGQAIEDAITLANAFMSSAQPLKVYEQKRLKHTNKVTTLSRQIGWASQWSNPFAVAFRNTVFPLIPSQLLFKRLQFLFQREL